MHRLLFPLLGSLLLLGSQLSAQTAQISPGTRVRITAPEVTADPLTGAVVVFDAESLVLRRSVEEIVRIDSRQLHSLEMSRGRNKLLWALGGAGAGLVLGGVLGGAVGAGSDPQPRTLDELASGDWFIHWMDRMHTGVVVGSLVGVGAGAVTGALLAPERWRRVALPSR